MSMSRHGSALFNSLPKELRELSGVSSDLFGYKLDLYLSSIPDKPVIRGYSAFRRAPTNSILDQYQFVDADMPPGRRTPVRR